MHLDSKHLLASALVDPAVIQQLELGQWDLLIRQARSAELLGRLFVLLEERDLLSHVPEAALRHLSAGSRVTSRHAELICYEVGQIHKVLWQLGIPILILKGAAYVLSDQPPAEGRMFSDIDILVPKGDLPRVEKALARNGWITTHLDDYDQQYYRKWMHELPPLKHARRRTVLDVHHAILPETARLHPSPQKMLATSVAVPGFEDLYTLCPEDMVLHSATHLFHDGELEHGLRDLVDIDALLRHFSRDIDFWDRIVERASQLDLVRPLFYALHYASRILQTPIPKDVIAQVEKIGSPNRLVLNLMDRLFMRGLRPDHVSCNDAFTGIARWILYVRSHYLRMPAHLLIPHLFYKAFITPLNERKAEKLAAERPSIQRLLTQAKTGQ